MLGFRSAAVATLWVSLSAATAGVLAAQAQSDADQRTPRFLLAVAGARKPIDVQRTPALSRHIALDFNGETLAVALATITRRSGLQLAYTEDVLPRDARVHLQASRISVAGALSAVLLDSGVDVVFTSGSRASLVRRAAIAPPAVGTIVGRVTDAKTGEELEGAEVMLEGTQWRAFTARDGQYRLSDVEAGNYTLVARRIGYGRQVRAVSMAANQDLTVDIALQPTPTQLQEIVTTGTLVPTEVRALPTPVTVISERDISQRGPHLTQDLLREAVPGAISWVSPARPELTAYSTRGASTLSPGIGQMKVIVDGIEAANPTISPVDPSSIERVEVIRGPQAAAIYGSDAIGGVVQVFTKRGYSGLARPRVDAQAALGVLQTPYDGFNGVLRQTLRASIRGGTPEVGYSLGGGYSRTGDYLPGGEVSRQSNPSVYAGMHFAHGIVSVDLTGRHDVQDNPGVVNPEFSQTGLAFYSRPLFQASRYTNQALGSRLTLSPVPWWHHTISVGVDQLKNEIVQSQPRLTTPGDTLLTLSNTLQTKSSVSYTTSLNGGLSPAVSGTLSAGFSHWRLPATSFFTTTALATSGAIQPADGGSLLGNRTVTTNTGVFLQAQAGFREALFVTAGLRLERNTDLGDSLGAPVSPRLGLAYVRSAGDLNVKVRASWGRAIRAPLPGNKLGSISATSVILASPELGPERQEGWDAGVDLAVGSKGYLSATYFDQTAGNLLQFVQVATEPILTNQWQNIGRVSNTGIELEGALALGMVQLKAQYAYVRARIEQLAPNYTGNLSVGDQSLATPRHTSGIGLTMNPRVGTLLSGALTYVGDFRQTDFVAQLRCFGGTGPCQPTQRDYVVNYPGFVKLNAALSQQVTPVLAGFVSIDNLTNNHSFELFNVTPVVGRITTVGLKVSY